MINWSLNRFGVFLSKTVDFKIKKEELNGLIYPIYPEFKEKVDAGKRIFGEFLKTLYTNNYSKVEQEFCNLDNIVQEEKNYGHIISKKLTIRDIIEYRTLSYDNVDYKKQYLSIYCKNFNDDPSILDRLYYQLYIIKEYAMDSTNECIYEYLYEILINYGITNQEKIIYYKF